MVGKGNTGSGARREGSRGRAKKYFLGFMKIIDNLILLKNYHREAIRQWLLLFVP